MHGRVLALRLHPVEAVVNVVEEDIRVKVVTGHHHLERVRLKWGVKKRNVSVSK